MDKFSYIQRIKRQTNTQGNGYVTAYWQPMLQRQRQSGKFVECSDSEEIKR